MPWLSGCENGTLSGYTAQITLPRASITSSGAEPAPQAGAVIARPAKAKQMARLGNVIIQRPFAGSSESI